MNHNWSATKQRPHPQSVAEISRHSVLSGDKIQRRGASFGRLCRDRLYPAPKTKTESIDVVKACQSFTGSEVPSCVLKRKTDKFILRFNCVENTFLQFL